MKKEILFLIVPVLLLACSKKLDLPKVDEGLKQKLLTYIQSHYMSPEDYVISRFKAHDVVFIGEFHRIKHDVELIQHLIPKLYENGVFTLATEFARREDQPLIDSLLGGATYDEKLARRIAFNQYVEWGYQEYLDIFKAAWQLNHGLPKDGRRFRILGLNDSPDWSFVKTRADRDKDSIKKLVWRGGGEQLWAGVILDDVVAKGEKALIYSGIHHAFTEYQQPLVDVQKQAFIRFEDRRMGNFVFRAIGKRAITIFLHSPWYRESYDQPDVYPADGIIDAVLQDLPPQTRRVGFDTRGTPFGKLSGKTSIYRLGYDDFSLEMFCDGYIYQGSLSECEGVTPIPDFVNEGNLDRARQQAPSPWFRTASVKDFYLSAREGADIKGRFARFR